MQKTLINILFLLILSLLVFGRAASSIGYSRLLWTFTSALAFYSNPLTLLYFLSILPNRKLDQDRQLKMSLLEQKIKKKGIKKVKILKDITNETISDESTMK
jgi:hypothetical protein